MSEWCHLLSDNVDYCRLCLAKPESNRLLKFYDIFSTSSQLMKLNQHIQNFLHIEIKKQDILPKIICEKCYKCLLDSMNMKNKAKQTQVILQYIGKQNAALKPEINYSPSTSGTNVSMDALNCAPSTSHDSIILPLTQSTVIKTIIHKSITETTIISSSSNFPSSISGQ